MQSRVDLALRSMDVAISATKPKYVFGLFSGGGDSTVACHVAARHDSFDGVVFIDTGTALPGVIEHVYQTAGEQNWWVNVARSPQTYEDMIREHGLPGPGQHSTAYVRLKEKALDAFVRLNCSKCSNYTRHRKHDTIMWVSGARSAESVRRMGQSDWVTVDGSQVWVNPILDWDNSLCRAYREMCDLPTSDVAALVHRSGECNCGTYAAKGERDMLCSFFPEFGQQIENWEALAREHGHFHAARWGEKPLKQLPGQTELVPRHQIACSDCAGRVEAEMT